MGSYIEKGIFRAMVHTYILSSMQASIKAKEGEDDAWMINTQRVRNQDKGNIHYDQKQYRI